jgi:hypothetical protein
MTDFKPYPIKEALEIIQNAKSVYVLSQISFKKPNREHKPSLVLYPVALSKNEKTNLVKKFSDWRKDLTMDLEIDGEEVCIG